MLLPTAIALLFAGEHLIGPKLKFLSVTPRSIWLSAAGGVSVAYVFVHLLPELSESQQTMSAAADELSVLAGVEHHAYLVALLGMVSFYGLERLACGSARKSRRGRSEPSAGVFWIHLAAFAAYNFLIGYLLVHREEEGTGPLLIYSVAMGLHFIINDYALREQHGAVYDEVGRWLLALAPVGGLVLGLALSVRPAFLAALFAFLGGGVVLNVLKEELPEERESRFWAFGLGAAGYAALLLSV